MKHLIVLPAVHRESTIACLDSMNDEARGRVVLVDNTDDGSIVRARDCSDLYCAKSERRNLGVAASWNYGIDCAQATGAQFLTICSTSIRFADGGSALCRTANFCVAQPQWPYGFESMHGWKLITLGRPTWRKVGRFDEAFYPGYFEDSDYIHRMRCARIIPFTGHTPSGRFRGTLEWVPPLGPPLVESTGDAQAIKDCGIEVNFVELEAYYVRKWGGKPGEEKFTAPFDGDAGASIHAAG